MLILNACYMPNQVLRGLRDGYDGVVLILPNADLNH